MDERRAAIIRRVGDLIRGDWSMNYFDGRDVKRWLNGALDGNPGLLAELDRELDKLEANYADA